LTTPISTSLLRPSSKWGGYLLWRGAYVKRITAETSQQALRDFGQRLLDKANEHVPFDTGNLKDSGAVVETQGRNRLGQFTSQAEVIVSYDTPYAVHLHEHPEFKFKPPGEGKWLERAIHKMNPLYERGIAPKFLMLYRQP